LARAELFDHFVGAHQKKIRDREPKRVRSSEIDDEIELDGQFGRDVLGFDAMQDLCNKMCRLPVHHRKTREICDETALFTALC
jgi:hypothetical protein